MPWNAPHRQCFPVSCNSKNSFQMTYSLLLTCYVLMTVNQDTTDANRIGKCFAKHKYSSRTLAKDLIGTWKLSKKRCYWEERRQQKSTLPNITISFSGNGAYAIFDSSTVIRKGHWYITLQEQSLWLKLDKSCEYLDANIMVCSDELYSNNYGSDGCEFLYRRIR